MGLHSQLWAGKAADFCELLACWRECGGFKALQYWIALYHDIFLSKYCSITTKY